jgi:hypothetical protein
MNLKTTGVLLATLWAISGCNNDGQTVGNGPGDADGAGGRADSPAAAVDETPNNAATTDPVGAHTKPDGSTEDTGRAPGETSVGTPPQQ